jgi:hypothetical protein
MAWTENNFGDTLATEIILPDGSAGTQLISLVFTYIYSHLWEPLGGPTTYAVGFLSVHTDTGVTEGNFHAAVFAWSKHGIDNTWATGLRHGSQRVYRIFVPVWSPRML